MFGRVRGRVSIVYIIQNVSSNVQTQKSIILLKVKLHFVLSCFANFWGNTSQKVRMKVSKHD